MTTQPNDNRLPVLRTCRLIWASLVIGCIVIAAVLIARSANTPSDATAVAPTGIFLAIAWGAVIIAVPMAFIMRGQSFKRGWVGNVVTPQAYVTGIIMACALCEGATIIGVILASIPVLRPIALIPPVVSFLALLLLWPNGKAMFPLQHPDDANPFRLPK